jgi:hypothetical protein
METMKIKKWSVRFAAACKEDLDVYIGKIQVAMIQAAGKKSWYVTKGFGGSLSRKMKGDYFTTLDEAKTAVIDWAAEKFVGFYDKVSRRAVISFGSIKNKKADIFVGKIKVGTIQYGIDRRKYGRLIPFKISFGLGGIYSCDKIMEFAQYENAQWFIRKTLEQNFPKFFR